VISIVSPGNGTPKALHHHEREHRRVPELAQQVIVGVSGEERGELNSTADALIHAEERRRLPGRR
jgi:hypothetical protein